MELKEKFKSFQRAFGRYSLFFCRWIIRKCSLPVFKVLKAFLMLFGRPLLAKKKKIAMKSLRIAFGNEKSDEELQKIAQDCFYNFGQGMVDLIWFIEHPEEMKKRVSFEGKEKLDLALENGKGAIIVSAHFGSFIMMYFRMVLEGYKTNVIMKRVRDEHFEKYISDFRAGWGLKTIYDLPARNCVQQCIKCLRNNEILFILMDQNYGGDGRVFVDFFGQKAATATGPYVFGSRTGAAVLPMFTSGTAPYEHKIVIQDPVEIEEQSDPYQTSIHFVAKITKILEDEIRKQPAEWGGWMHKRWKSRTRAEQTLIDRQNEMGVNRDHTLDYESV